MDFLSTLYQLIFMPLQIIFEVIYYLVFKLIGNPGISIIALSFIVNILVLPLYNRADAMQEAERDMELKLSKGVEHIKKTFSGDEQLMMLQTYYRQNNYSPLDQIKGSISLFLEIPFFVAAYQFLSHLDLLNGASLGPIKDLGAPDGLLSIFGMTINVLPFIMTAVNLVSAYIFTKDLTRKTKIQLYGMACFFLVFLYASPAGLVCYWTLNNIFNLIKTIICKMEDTDKGINVAMFVCSVIVMIYSLLTSPNYKVVLQFLAVALLLNARFIVQRAKRFFPKKEATIYQESNTKIFILGALFLALLIGAVIPSAVIESSPQEFVIANYMENPLLYLVSSSAIAVGTFVIWGGVFYWLASVEAKISIERAIWTLCGVALVNYMAFGKELGLLTSTLQYENSMYFSRMERTVNFIVLIITFLMMSFIYKYLRKKILDVLVVSTLALISMVMLNVINIHKSITEIVTNDVHVSNDKVFSLSKNGKNVIVIMLDRAIGAYMPYFLKEKPFLKNLYDGFTYYDNVISFGGHTVFAAPAIFGGYEYTPVEINKRDKESLVKKHNEALKVMPVLFDREGFTVTVCDPTMASYRGIPDLSIYDEYQNIKKYNLKGTFGNVFLDKKDYVECNKRNFYCFGLMKSMPVIIQKNIYNNGDYFSSKSTFQKITSLQKASGYRKEFFENYNVLKNLVSETSIKDNGNTFLMMSNDITHEPMLLQLPEYQPTFYVNNEGMDNILSIKDQGRERMLNMENIAQVTHYHTNMVTLLELGKWFDFMRQHNVYDNTKIIIVSDHGAVLNQLDNLILDSEDVMKYYPLLLVKDFYSNGFKISDEFMTNADVPSIACKDAIRHIVNPFTNKLLNSENKLLPQYVFASKEFQLNKNKGNTFLPEKWYIVHADMRKNDNWQVVKENAILPY